MKKTRGILKRKMINKGTIDQRKEIKRWKTEKKERGENEEEIRKRNKMEKR